MQSLWLLIPLFVFSILISPLIFQVKISYNVFKNNGTFSIKLWFIRLSLATFKLKNRMIVIRTKKKSKQLELALSGPEIKLLEQFAVQIKDKLKLRKVEFHSKIGLNDAFQSAMLSSSASLIISIIFSRIKYYKNTAQISIVNHTSYNKRSFQTACMTRFSISIFEILYSFIMASIILNKNDSRKGYVQVKNK